MPLSAHFSRTFTNLLGQCSSPSKQVIFLSIDDITRGDDELLLGTGKGKSDGHVSLTLIAPTRGLIPPEKLFSVLSAPFWLALSLNDMTRRLCSFADSTARLCSWEVYSASS